MVSRLEHTCASENIFDLKKKKKKFGGHFFLFCFIFFCWNFVYVDAYGIIYTRELEHDLHPSKYKYF